MVNQLPRPSLPLAALVLSLTAGALTLGCHKKKDDTLGADTSPVSSAPKVAPPVRFAKSEARNLPQTVELSGSLAADETSEVASQVAGVVSKVNVDVGTRVKKGDLLVQLDAREASLRAAQASATRAQAQDRLALPAGSAFAPDLVPDVKVAKEAYDLAKLDADRSRTLFDSGALSEAAWDQVRIRADQAKAQYDIALAGARQSYASLRGATAASGLASKTVADTMIRAPFDGSIAEKRIAVGEFATIGRVVAVVVHDNPLRLKLDVSESDVAKVQVGAKVEFSVVSFPGKIFVGEIKRIGASIKSQSRALPVEADVPNDEATLRPGMFARARVVVPGGPTKAILVPESAIGTTGSTSRVFVKTGNRVSERLVVPGRRVGALVEVIGALAENEEVATTNIDKLGDGAEISAQP
jgi:RND family efflux transporter MFP subunit